MTFFILSKLKRFSICFTSLIPILLQARFTCSIFTRTQLFFSKSPPSSLHSRKEKLVLVCLILCCCGRGKIYWIFQLSCCDNQWLMIYENTIPIFNLTNCKICSIQTPLKCYLLCLTYFLFHLYNSITGYPFLTNLHRR